MPEISVHAEIMRLYYLLFFRETSHNVGAVTIKIGFWGMLY